jgi:hypothetical protein
LTRAEYNFNIDYQIILNNNSILAKKSKYMEQTQKQAETELPPKWEDAFSLSS